MMIMLVVIHTCTRLYSPHRDASRVPGAPQGHHNHGGPQRDLHLQTQQAQRWGAVAEGRQAHRAQRQIPGVRGRHDTIADHRGVHARR